MELVDEYIAVRKKLEEERARLVSRLSEIDEALGRRRESTVVDGRATLDELRKLESFDVHDVVRVRGWARPSAYAWLSKNAASGRVRRVRRGVYAVVDGESERRT